MRPALPRRPHAFAAALCLGIAAATGVRGATPVVACVAVLAVALGAASADAARRPLALFVGLALAGWWWGSVRLDALDRSALVAAAGTAERALVVVTGPVRRGRFQLRAPGEARRYGALALREAVLLELPRGRSPPQGALLEVLARVSLPRGPDHGFDERTWLRRHGVHVVLHADRWRIVGRRGGLGGVADRVHAALARSIAPGLGGERRAILAGVVLGDDGGLSDELRARFRASGLYHLLAVSGQNVALVAGAVLAVAWLAGAPRVAGEIGALVAMGLYVLAVGAQPSVVRAGVAGALGSIAWLTARQKDRWYFLLLGALALLAWNPYSLLDAGFQLSFAAVAAIFTLVRPLRRRLEGYPLPGKLADVVAVSAACGLATAPISLLQFHAVPLLTVPANALAEPAVIPLLGIALASAAAGTVSASAAAALAWVNGWCAAYLAACARAIGAIPGAQAGPRELAALLVAAGALRGCAYAWRAWRTSSSPST